MDPHALAEERSLAYHRAVAARLPQEPALLERARARVAGWLARGEVHPRYAEAWREALAGPPADLCALLVDPGERARALRQVTPFAGALGPRERWRLWRAARERAGGERDA